MQNKVRRVMLIDDNEIDLKINTRLITLAALFDEIISCPSGEEALNYLHKRVNTPEELPDFILLDIQMPEMDGFEFLEQYKDFPVKSRIAMLSSTLDFGDIQRAEANPYVISLLKKPLSTSALAELIG